MGEWHRNNPEAYEQGWGPPEFRAMLSDEIRKQQKEEPAPADDPRRDRSINAPLECEACGLLFEGDPKDDDACPRCEEPAVRRRQDR